MLAAVTASKYGLPSIVSLHTRLATTVYLELVVAASYVKIKPAVGSLSSIKFQMKQVRRIEYITVLSDGWISIWDISALCSSFWGFECTKNVDGIIIAAGNAGSQTNIKSISGWSVVGGHVEEGSISLSG